MTVTFEEFSPTHDFFDYKTTESAGDTVTADIAASASTGAASSQSFAAVPSS